MQPSRFLFRAFEMLTFMNMPIRQKFTLFALGVSLWFVVIGALGAFAEGTIGRSALLGAELIAHALLILFAISITRSLTGPIDGIIQQIRVLTKGNLDLGPWEQIFYGEFDGRRRKRVLVKIIGE